MSNQEEVRLSRLADEPKAPTTIPEETAQPTAPDSKLELPVEGPVSAEKEPLGTRQRHRSAWFDV